MRQWFHDSTPLDSRLCLDSLTIWSFQMSWNFILKTLSICGRYSLRKYYCEPGCSRGFKLQEGCADGSFPPFLFALREAWGIFSMKSPLGKPYGACLPAVCTQSGIRVGGGESGEDEKQHHCRSTLTFVQAWSISEQAIRTPRLSSAPLISFVQHWCSWTALSNPESHIWAGSAHLCQSWTHFFHSRAYMNISLGIRHWGQDTVIIIVWIYRFDLEKLGGRNYCLSALLCS